MKTSITISQVPHSSSMGVRRCRRSGFTLIDLLIALSITVMIGGTVATMIAAVAQGTVGAQDGRRHLVRMQALQAQLGDIVRSSRCILAAGTGYMVYWTNDNNADFALQLSELEMLELDTTTNQLKRYRFAPADSSQDFTYPANSNWYTTVQAVKTGPSAVVSLVSSNVTAFTVSLDNSNAGAHLANMSVTLTDQGVTRSAAIGCAVRSYAVPQ